MVNDATVDFLRHALVKTTVTSLHVEDRNFRRLAGSTAMQLFVSPAPTRHRVAPGPEAIHSNDNRPMVFSSTTRLPHSENGPVANLQVVKEDLVELVVVVLPRYHQHMIRVLIQLCQHP